MKTLFEEAGEILRGPESRERSVIDRLLRENQRLCVKLERLQVSLELKDETEKRLLGAEAQLSDVRKELRKLGLTI